MTKHEIYIRVDYEGAYRIENKSNALRIAFEKDEPYDKLSRRFKKFIYKPRYPKHEEYIPSDYDLYIVSKNFQLYNYILNFLNPNKKILSVEVYFQLDDEKNYQPLIFGFNYEGSETDYYTYHYLNGISYKVLIFPYNQKGSLPKDGCFNDDDLITRLLEEYGLQDSTRYNKFVIKLEKRAHDTTPVLYPKSGNNKERIAVKKSEIQEHLGFVKYVHAIDQRNNVEEFFIGFGNNTLFMFGNSGLRKLLFVDVYFGLKVQLVVIVFKFQKGHKLYKGSQFLNDVNNTKSLKSISKLITFNEEDLTLILNEEASKFKQEIEFRKGPAENIYISEKYVCLKGTKFFLVSLKPNTKEDNKGSSIGPWIVYSDRLFSRNPHIKIDAISFKGINNSTFTSIDLYYNEKNEPLLVVFVGSTHTKFFKRANVEGNKWVEEHRPSYTFDRISIVELLNISNPLFTTLGLALDKKNEYHNSVFINGTNNQSRISVIKQSNGPADFKAEGYVCYEHKLFDYYGRSNTKGTVPKLVLEPAIGTIQIRFIGPNDKMAWPLTYTSPDHSTFTKNESVFVYFGMSNSVSSTRDNDDSDTLPLLFCYNDKFYTPKSKDQYFGLWIDQGITGSTNEGGVLTPQKRLKEALDRNFNVANEIDLTKTKNYGISCCGIHAYYFNKHSNFSTKRVDVTKYSNTNYTMYIHKTVNDNKIGFITHSNYELSFVKHTDSLKNQTINEVAVIYSDSTSTFTPLLVLLNKSSKYSSDSSTTYGFYFFDNESKRGDTFDQYTFKAIKGGCNLMSKLMGQGGDDGCLRELSQSLRQIWSELTAKKMDRQPSSDLDEDTSDCKGPFEDKEKESSGRCHEVQGLDKSEEEERGEQRSQGQTEIIPETASSPSDLDKKSQSYTDDRLKQGGGDPNVDVSITPVGIPKEGRLPTLDTTVHTSTTISDGRSEAPKPIDAKTESTKPAGSGPSHVISPQPFVPLKEKDKIIDELELSLISQTNYGPSSKITVSKMKYYPQCDLFCYFTHSLNDNSTFTCSSLITGISQVKITHLTDVFKQVKSVNVYFNRYNLNNPVMICVISKNGETIYYKELIPITPVHPLSTLKIVDENNLTDELINESDKVNNSLTYHIEMTVITGVSVNYGHDNSIKVTKTPKISNRFTFFSHEPNKGQIVRSFVLFNQKLPLTKIEEVKTTISEVQDKKYKKIQVYSLDSDLELPLIMELFEDRSKTTYVYRKDGAGFFWEKKSENLFSDDKIEALLFEINYPLKKSVIIELNKNEATEYEMKLIDNTLKNINNKEYEKAAYKDGRPLDSQKKIKVSTPLKVIDSSWKTSTDYKFFSHDIPESIKLSDISGIRIFITRSGGTQADEIEFYDKDSDATQPKKKRFLYYPTKKNLNKIYGYFHSKDSRPLLMCYDRCLYKRLNIDDNSKWICVNDISCSESSQVIDILKSVHQTMKKKLTFVKSGKLENITVFQDETVGKFKRIKYKADTRASVLKSSFTLPISTITDGLTDKSLISKLLGSLQSSPFDSVSRYYQNDVNNPFLYEFIDDSVKTHFRSVDGVGKYWIEKRVDYNTDSDLGIKLKKLKLAIDSTVIYEIDKKSSGYNSSVKVDKDPNFNEPGFTKYTHYPVDGQNKFSFILYRNDQLKKRGKDEVEIFKDIENTKYKNISVYFGTKAIDKVTGFDENVPLIIELFNGGLGVDSRSYYMHRRNSKTNYWELANFVSGGNRDRNILTLLKQTEFDFLESIVILTDMYTRYGEKEISSAINNLNVKNHIFEAYFDSNSLTVIEKNRSQCFLESGFKYREYNIERVKQDVWYGLRFFTHSSRDKKYNELTLNDSKNNYKEFLYHKKNNSDDKVSIYFYGEDPRPLLLCYRKDVYRPMNLNDYFDRWYKDITVPKCCQEYSANYELLQALSKVVGFLNEVNLDIRPHTSEKTPKKNGSVSESYDTQNFNGKAIKIKVTYRNLCCYRVYTHKHSGMVSNGAGFRLGNIKYFNKGPELTKLTYDLTNQLECVSIYYHLRDNYHRFPLLVQLEFKGEKKEFFIPKEKGINSWVSLKKNQDESLIKKLNDLDTQKLEGGLYQLRQDLKITFETDSKDYLFYADECKEDSSNNAAVIGGSVGGVVGTAAVTGGVTTVALKFPEVLVPVIKALT